MPTDKRILTCRRLWLLTVLALGVAYLLSIDWTLADRVIREFENARSRDTIRAQVFGGKTNWIVPVGQPIKELIPIGTPKDKVLSALGSGFNLKPVTRPSLHEGFRKRYGDYDAALCGGDHSGYLVYDSYILCLFFKDDLLSGVHAQVKLNWL